MRKIPATATVDLTLTLTPETADAVLLDLDAVWSFGTLSDENRSLARQALLDYDAARALEEGDPTLSMHLGIAVDAYLKKLLISPLRKALAPLGATEVDVIDTEVA